MSKNLHAVRVNLGNCYISDTEIEILIKHIRQVPSCRPKVSLYLNNIMSHRVIKSISDTLIQTSVLQVLLFDKCFHPAVTDIKSAIKYLIDGVSRNTSLTHLTIIHCSLSSAHAYHVALLVAVCNSACLDLPFHNIRSAIPFIAEAIKYNTLIEELTLCGC